MNKVWLIGEVTYLDVKPNVTNMLLKTVEQTASGKAFTAAPPPIKIFPSTVCSHKIRKGDIVRVDGHVQREEFEGTHYDEIISYLVTKNLSLNMFLGTGNLGANAQWTSNQEAVFFNVACRRFYGGKSHTDWVRSVLFSPSKASVPLLQQGQSVVVTGRMEQNRRELEGKKVYNTSLIVSGWQAFNSRP